MPSASTNDAGSMAPPRSSGQTSGLPPTGVNGPVGEVPRADPDALHVRGDAVGGEVEHVPASGRRADVGRPGPPRRRPRGQLRQRIGRQQLPGAQILRRRDLQVAERPGPLRRVGVPGAAGVHRVRVGEVVVDTGVGTAAGADAEVAAPAEPVDEPDPDDADPDPPQPPGRARRRHRRGPHESEARRNLPKQTRNGLIITRHPARGDVTPARCRGSESVSAGRS